MPRAQGYCFGCVLERALGIAWLSCFGLLTRLSKWKDVNEKPPKTTLRQISREARTCTKDRELSSMQVYTYSTFSLFYHTRLLFQWIILMPWLEWLTAVRSASSSWGYFVKQLRCKSTKPSQWDFFSAIAKVLLKRFHSLDPQPSEVIGNFPMVCYRLGLRLSCVSKMAIKYFKELNIKTWYERVQEVRFSLKKWKFDWTDWFKKWKHFWIQLEIPPRACEAGIFMRRKEGSKPHGCGSSPCHSTLALAQETLG